jgi:hypothetical protein
MEICCAGNACFSGVNLNSSKPQKPARTLLVALRTTTFMESQVKPFIGREFRRPAAEGRD